MAPFLQVMAVAILSAVAMGRPALSPNDESSDKLLAPRLFCQPPTPLAKSGANIMMIGDSISMGSSGYSLFVQQMLQTATGGTLAGSVQHGGGFGGGGQMASSSNGANKVADCMGNATGALPPKAWSVITYNAGLHDCDTKEFVTPEQYAFNLKAVFETLKPAASAVGFVTTTPYDMPLTNGVPPYPAGINMSCVLERNEIARAVIAEVGGVFVDDLYAYVEDFCHVFPSDPATSPYPGNYTTCAIQTTGLHFFTARPYPSGQQYTALSVASQALTNVPEHEISNATADSDVARVPNLTAPALTDCGNPPAPLNKSLPNVLIIGDSISEPGSGYGPGVEAILENPVVQNRGPLASVQHSGGSGSNQAGPTTNGAACAASWVGHEKWDVITVNFGIHDCAPGGDGRPNGSIVPAAEYIANLKTIYGVLHDALAPGGTILWVSTTPVSSTAAAPFAGKGPAGWGSLGECISQYNTAAAATLGLLADVEMIDLHSAVTEVCGVEYDQCNLQLWSNVHFTTAGKQFCAVQVAAGIAPRLNNAWRHLLNETRL